MKRMCKIIIVCMIIALTGGCSKAESEQTQETTTEETTESSPTDALLDVYMDDFALDIVKEACQARWDRCRETESDFNYINDNNRVIDGHIYGEMKWLKELLTDYNQTEYDVICKYTSDNFNDRKFKDAKLKSYMIAYADATEKQLEIGKHTDFSSVEENENYESYIVQKSQSILDIMDAYDLKFDSDYISESESLKTTVEELGDND